MKNNHVLKIVLNSTTIAINNNAFLNCPSFNEIDFPDSMKIDLDYSKKAFAGLENTLSADTVNRLLRQYGKDIFGSDIIPIYANFERQEFLSLITQRKNSLKVRQSYNKDLIEVIDNENINAVSRLLAAGADPNGIGDRNAISPLGLACNKGNIEIVKLLLEYGANPNFVPEGQMSALSYAVIGPAKPEIIKYLIFTGVDLNYHTEENSQAIFWPVMLGHADIVKILIDAGADKNVKDKDNKSLLDLANRIGWKSVVEVLTSGQVKTDMSKLITISIDKLTRNLVDIGLDSYYEPFWNNEIIAVPRGYLEILDLQKTMWGTLRYLVAVNGTTSTLKPFYIETKRSLRTMRSGYSDLLFEDLRIRKTSYSNYRDGRLEKETFIFSLVEES
jgi:hypothetical protein